MSEVQRLRRAAPHTALGRGPPPRGKGLQVQRSRTELSLAGRRTSIRLRYPAGCAMHAVNSGHITPSSVAPPNHQREANPGERPTDEPETHSRGQLQRDVKLPTSATNSIRPGVCRSSCRHAPCDRSGSSVGRFHEVGRRLVPVRSPRTALKHPCGVRTCASLDRCVFVSVWPLFPPCLICESLLFGLNRHMVTKQV